MFHCQSNIIITTIMLLSIKVLILLTISSVNCDPLRKRPKIYNAVITSSDNLQPSKAYPIIQPVIQPAAIAYQLHYPYVPNGPNPNYVHHHVYPQRYYPPSQPFLDSQNYGEGTIPENQGSIETDYRYSIPTEERSIVDNHKEDEIAKVIARSSFPSSHNHEIKVQNKQFSDEVQDTSLQYNFHSLQNSDQASRHLNLLQKNTHEESHDNINNHQQRENTDRLHHLIRLKNNDSEDKNINHQVQPLETGQYPLSFNFNDDPNTPEIVRTRENVETGFQTNLKHNTPRTIHAEINQNSPNNPHQIVPQKGRSSYFPEAKLQQTIGHQPGLQNSGTEGSKVEQTLSNRGTSEPAVLGTELHNRSNKYNPHQLVPQDHNINNPQLFYPHETPHSHGANLQNVPRSTKTQENNPNTHHIVPQEETNKGKQGTQQNSQQGAPQMSDEVLQIWQNLAKENMHFIQDPHQLTSYQAAQHSNVPSGTFREPYNPHQLVPEGNGHHGLFGVAHQNYNTPRFSTSTAHHLTHQENPSSLTYKQNLQPTIAPFASRRNDLSPIGQVTTEGRNDQHGGNTVPMRQYGDILNNNFRHKYPNIPDIPPPPLPTARKKIEHKEN